MKKEKVIEIKVVKINDEWSTACIIYQNTEVLKRGEFVDEMLNVKSNYYPAFNNGSMEFYLRGRSEHNDNTPFNIKNENVSYLLNKINIINKKYGIPKRWRVEKGKKYYFLNTECEIRNIWEDKTKEDETRYNLGNYFKTEEEAQKVKEELDRFWAKVRAGEFGGDEQ